MDDQQLTEIASEKTETAAKGSLRFAVTTVPSRDENDETDEFLNQSTMHGAENTIGYSTHEAVPMTVFYRNELSHTQGKPKAKARPTLDQLRKGFESESPETQVSNLLNFDVYYA
jgi:hypothetical protein